MSISELLIKVVGVIVLLLGLALIMGGLGVTVFGVNLPPIWLGIIVGLLLIGFGIWIIRGGTIQL